MTITRETVSPTEASSVVDLNITGMTCASCVARIERKLNKIPGVTATVNLPLESAHVLVPPDVSPEMLVGAVEAAGYGASVIVPKTYSEPEATSAYQASLAPISVSPESEGAAVFADENAGADSAATPIRGYAGDIDLHGKDLQHRLILAAILSVPIVVISMVMPLHFPGWAWVVGVLTLPVATWAAWPFHKAAFRAARHGTSTMDTLVSLGVIAAFIWSTVELLLGNAAHDPYRHGFWAMPNIYFEVAAVVVTFLLAGRYAEHRSRRRAGDALRALLALGAKDADVVLLDDDGQPVRNAIGTW
ncbi:MAG: cation transporter, partial [Promicromonosporaceae bacterium]|nr:cation transporter [Promicromonosporaceae bacterium]